jgi:hypothetical protein
MSRVTIRIINTLVFLALVALSIGVIKYIVILWPSSSGDVGLRLCGMDINTEKRYFLLVALGGVLGSFVHIATSFVDYLGNKQIVISWVPWYLMRPFIGASLAIIFYMLLRGGIVSTQAISTSTDQRTMEVKKVKPVLPGQTPAGGDSLADTLGKKPAVKQAPVISETAAKQTIETERKPDPPLPFNPFGIMAIACLTGMFSKQAADKLREVFESLFNIKKPSERTDKLTDPARSNDSGNNDSEKEG